MELTTEAIKKSLRKEIVDLAGTWKQLNAAIAARLKEIEAEKKAGISPIPIIEFDTLLNNAQAINKGRIKQRGCVIIKNVFPRELAKGWNTEVHNLSRNLLRIFNRSFNRNSYLSSYSCILNKLICLKW